MKSLQRLCTAVALTFVLILPAFAGDMHTGPGITSPPPPAAASATAWGDMHTPRSSTRGGMDTGSGVSDTAGDSFTEAVLSLLERVLSLF